MKLNKVLIILFASTLVIGCKKNDGNKDEKILDDITEEEAIDQIPRVSDEHFDNAIKAYEAKNKSTAAKYINEGVLALKAEGKDVSGLYKVNLDNAIEQLENIEGRLENNEDISSEGLKEAILNAEINIAHEYLSTTEDVYVLVRPENVASAKTKRHFSAMFSNLKSEKEKMKEGAKKDGDALLKEGEILEKELADWETKAKAYTKKANEHFKISSSEYYYPFGF